MASSLHESICEVKGEVKLLATNTISRRVKQQPGMLRLTQMGDTFYIQCVYDNGTKPSKKYKLDPKQVNEAQLVARDGKLTVYLTGGCARFHLDKGIENEIQTFMSCLDDIKRTVLTKAAAKYEISNISPIPRVDTLFGSKETSSKPPTLVLRRPGKGAFRTPQKVNEMKEQPKLMLQTSNKTPQQELKLAAQQGNRQQAFDKIPSKNFSENQVKPVQKLTAQQGNRQQTPDKASLTNVSLHKAKNEFSRKSLGENSQQSSNKTAPLSTPKLCQHPRNQQKQKMSEREDDLEKENINTLIGSPERQKSYENQSDLAWSTFGTPRKKAPLKENETSPELTRPTNVKCFYGNNGSSIRVKRARKPLISSSSSPSQTPRQSLLSTTPTVPRNIQSQNKTSSGHLYNIKQSTLFSYLGSNEVTSQGFTNLGNTCYMNAILQSLLGLVPFVQELDNNDLLNTVGRLSLYNCMYNLFRWKNDDGSSRRKKNALKRLKNSLNSSEMTKRFSGYRQNDAHEFMNICLDQMKEEVREALGEKSENIAAKVCPVVRNFEGCLKKYIKCKGCKDVVTKDELFNHLSLNIPHNQSRSPAKVQLTRLVGHFFQAEELERSCEKCQCSTAVQFLKIRTLPRVIILHLLRSEFDQHRGREEKNSHRIQVDRFLEIGSFCSSDISGPPPFVPKKTSPAKSQLTADNETPFTNEDFVVAKPRRRLNMSVADNELSDHNSEKSNSNSKKSKTLPDWVYEQTKRPTLSFYSDTSDDDDDDLKKAKLASLRETQLKLSEEQQIQLATIASLQEKQAVCEKEMFEGTNTQKTEENLTHADSEDERIKTATNVILKENITYSCKEPVNWSEIERHQKDEALVDNEQIEREKNGSLKGSQEGSSEEQINCTRTTKLQREPTQFRKHEQIESTKIKSLQGNQTDFNDKLQDKLSRREKQRRHNENGHDGHAKKLEQALMANLEAEQKKVLELGILSGEDVSEAELMEIDRIEESVLSSDSEGLLPVENNITSNTKNMTDSKPLENFNYNESANNSTNSSRKRSSFDSDGPVVYNTQSTTKRDLKSEVTKLDTPSKRRKVEKIETEIVSSDGDEDVQLKKVLEISKKEHEKSRSEQEAIERSQMEEAIRMSIEDGLTNTTVKDMVIEETTEENIEVEKMETEKSPADEFSYRLVSVVSHVGSNASTGHYISDVYDVGKDQWTRYDDITAKKIKEYVARYDKISDGYIYFYMHKTCVNQLLNQNSNENATLEQ